MRRLLAAIFAAVLLTSCGQGTDNGEPATRTPTAAATSSAAGVPAVLDANAELISGRYVVCAISRQATISCWGEDGSTLFITSNTLVYRIRLNTKGVGTTVQGFRRLGEVKVFTFSNTRSGGLQ